MCRVSGWGYTSPSTAAIPSTLRTVTLPIVSTQACNGSASFGGNITENMICAGDGGKDACKVRLGRTGGAGGASLTFPTLPGRLRRAAGVPGPRLRAGVLGGGVR